MHIKKLKMPYTLIKTAMSLDGYIDDLSDLRLILSTQSDRDAVDALKSTFDGILVGAETIRKDHPSLLIKSAVYRKKRLENGQTEHPIKITLTQSGVLDINNSFFQKGDVEKIIYCPSKIKHIMQNKIGSTATVVGLYGETINPKDLLEDLYKRGIKRLMIEGGSVINSMFLKEGLVNSLRIAIAPFFVGEAGASKFTLPIKFPQDKNNPMKLESTEILDDMVVLNYKIMEYHSF